MGHLSASTREFVQDLSRPIARSLRLAKLPEHAHVIVASTLAFFFIHLVGSPITSKALFPKSYGRLKTKQARNNWNNHAAALVHSLVIIPLSFRTLHSPALNADRAFGYDPKFGTVEGIACGYFLWDTIESLWHFADVGFVIHGFACFCIYLLSFKPFIAYYGSRFLLWELSTPFLNIHWFLDKMNFTGSTIQLVNGIFLLTSFAGARLVYGTIQSYKFFQTLFSIKGEVPLAVMVTYGLGNVVLNGLNVMWFYKMLAALRKRMRPYDEKKYKAIANGIANGDAKKLD